jgi:hypothetical protein
MDANCIDLTDLKSLKLGKAEVRGQTRIQKVCIRNITEAIRAPRVAPAIRAYKLLSSIIEPDNTHTMTAETCLRFGIWHRDLARFRDGGREKTTIDEKAENKGVLVGGQRGFDRIEVLLHKGVIEGLESLCGLVGGQGRELTKIRDVVGPYGLLAGAVIQNGRAG